jgi:tripartite-type tricarboxylate transporter receptor subunit TctC
VLNRRSTILAGAAALSALSLGSRSPRAQQRPITIVVPYAPGGGTDIVAREFVPIFSKELGGQTVIVENKGGAAGYIGSLSVARARPDGQTLLFAVSTNIVVNPHLQGGERVDLATALAPVAQVSSYQYVLVVNPQLGVSTLQELIALAKARRSELTFSSSGVGSNNHLAGVLFAEAAGIRVEHVPYRGTAPALTDVVAGHVAMNFSSPPPAIPLIRTERLKALAATGEQRLPSLPDVPTLAEAGLPGVVIVGWHAIFAPAAILEKYEAAARRAAASPHFTQRLESDGLELPPERPRAAFAEAVKAESAFWAAKVRELDLKLE